MRAIETTGQIDDRRSVRLDADLPDGSRGPVRVVILFPESDEATEGEWLRAASRNPVFADLADSAEDIYTLADGKPFVRRDLNPSHSGIARFASPGDLTPGPSPTRRW